MPNRLKNTDLKLNLFSLVMDRDRIYYIMKKMTPSFWWTRSTTKYILTHYQKKEILVAEIGVDYGSNAKNILNFLPIKKLYLIDPYDDELDGMAGEQRYKKAKKLLVKYTNKIEFIKKKSIDALNDVPDALDFIYIDGNHEYESVKKDIELYFPRVKKGGILGGHDFWGNEVGVCKAVVEFVNANNLRLYGGLNDWWVVK